MASILALACFLGVCFAAAAMGVLFPPGDWYARLEKPFWQPPKWLFAPVWSLLYVMIAVSGWLVWLDHGFDEAGVALGVYFLQLLLNAIWTPIFFGLHRTGWALIDILLLWLSIAATILLFLPLQALAAWLLIPYLAWVSFALTLNAAIWRLNGPRRVTK